MKRITRVPYRYYRRKHPKRSIGSFSTDTITQNPRENLWNGHPAQIRDVREHVSRLPSWTGRAAGTVSAVGQRRVSLYRQYRPSTWFPPRRIDSAWYTWIRSTGFRCIRRREPGCCMDADKFTDVYDALSGRKIIRRDEVTQPDEWREGLSEQFGQPRYFVRSFRFSSGNRRSFAKWWYTVDFPLFAPDGQQKGASEKARCADKGAPAHL